MTIGLAIGIFLAGCVVGGALGIAAASTSMEGY